MSNAWTFDAHVAARFDREAHGHIPHYADIIGQSVREAIVRFPGRDARAIDIGSALGATMQAFRDAGFTDVHGVDRSEAMLAQSRVRENLILSDSFPAAAGPFDVVTANWTLHFISDPDARAAYITDVHAHMNPGGLFILTDKIESSPLEIAAYHDFKRAQGVPETEITQKAQSLEGVLVPLPRSWYLSTLRGAGFTIMSDADAGPCFATFTCIRA